MYIYTYILYIKIHIYIYIHVTGSNDINTYKLLPVSCFHNIQVFHVLLFSRCSWSARPMAYFGLRRRSQRIVPYL